MNLYHHAAIRKLFNAGIGNIVEYPKTTTTAAHVQLLDTNVNPVDLNETDHNVLIIIQCTETFADGSGARPTFKIGQTGTVEKFAASATVDALTIGQKIVVVGTLTVDTDLLVTATVATGTATGAIKVTSQAFPLTQ